MTNDKISVIRLHEVSSNKDTKEKMEQGSEFPERNINELSLMPFSSLDHSCGVFGAETMRWTRNSIYDLSITNIIENLDDTSSNKGKHDIS